MLNFYDRQLLQRILAQDAVLGKTFDNFIKRVTPMLARYQYEGGAVWVKNRLIERSVNKEIENLQEELELLLRENQNWAWELAERKNDSLVRDYIKSMAITSSVKEGLFAHNITARDSFIKRTIKGFNPSQRVWRISEQAKIQLEFFLQTGLGEGRSAATLSRDIRQLLRDPDTLFRRVRDKNGNLVPSKPMKDFHPGRGRYRSAYKEALRLTSTEINMAYRTADYERWQNMDNVVGFEVKLSSVHPRTDICDHMKGRYPKDFKFTGWHPLCICFAVPILIPEEDYIELLASEKSKQAITEKHSIKDIPKNASSYINQHQQAIDGWKNAPYWVQDNFKDGKLSNGLTFKQ